MSILIREGLIKKKDKPKDYYRLSEGVKNVKELRQICTSTIQ